MSTPSNSTTGAGGGRAVSILRAHRRVEHDVTQSIGRYRPQDEIGTPFAVTVDSDGLQDRAITIRAQDTMEHLGVPVARLVETRQEKLAGWL